LLVILEYINDARSHGRKMLNVSKYENLRWL